MNKHERHIAALSTAAKKQPDPVKRGKIVEKIREIQSKQQQAAWLSQ